jgi:hypothetical protein
MDTTIELCRAEADDCLRHADIDTNESDRPLWATLAQSWLQLAEQADQLSSDVRDAELERAVEAALI